MRVASRGKRDVFAILPAVMRLPNPDPTLLEFGRGRGHWGIRLYSQIIRQFAFIGGYCAQWVDHVLAIDRVIKPAQVDDPDQQKLANAAALRAAKAWKRVKNRTIVLQKLLMGRFYGFSRAEKVWRFDPILKEWIQDLFDVPWEAWLFDDSGRDYLSTVLAPFGNEVDPAKFIHFQWGSADTKYGAGVLSEIYLALWFIQQIQEFGLQALEDYSKLIAIVHVPRTFNKTDREKTLSSVSDQYRFYVTVPSDETTVRIETPAITVTANGAAGRQEYDAIRFYERWIQIRLLGAPQTQDKSLGTGKLEDTRAGIWEDKTPLASEALDQTLTDQWLHPYFDVNDPTLPLELRPRFESDSSEIGKGIDGRQAQQAIDIGVKLAANQLTPTFAVEMLAALGIPRPRAQAMVDSVVREAAQLAPVPETKTQQPQEQLPPLVQPGVKEVVAIMTDNGVIEIGCARILTKRGVVPIEELTNDDELVKIIRRAA